MPPASLSDLKVGVATASLGMAPVHTLEEKYAALQQAGFRYTEIGFGNYMDWVKTQVPDCPASTCPEGWGEGGEPDPSDEELWSILFTKAEDMKALAQSYGLTILMLQPLNQFDGWPEGTTRAKWSREKAERWLPLCSKLGVEMLQVGSNNDRGATATDDKAADDLKWLADLGAQQNPPVKIAYEAWCFSWRVASWEHAMEIVEKGNHPNLGLCLDIAHCPLAPKYGFDPSTGQGWTSADIDALLTRLRKADSNKIFYVEVSDMVIPSAHTPLLGQGSHFDSWQAKAQSTRGNRFIWTICGRPVPLVGTHTGQLPEKGGARVVESLQAILESGFRGPIMFEMFEAIRMEEADPTIPLDYASACAESQRLLQDVMV